MRDLHFKFIIDDGELILRKCTFHRELAFNYKSGDDENTLYRTVTGGGWWEWDRENKVIYLYGDSHQFKGCTIEQIQDALPKTIAEDTAHFNWYFAGCELRFSTASNLKEAMADNELIYTIADRQPK